MPQVEFMELGRYCLILWYLSRFHSDSILRLLVAKLRCATTSSITPTNCKTALGGFFDLNSSMLIIGPSRPGKESCFVFIHLYDGTRIGIPERINWAHWEYIIEKQKDGVFKESVWVSPFYFQPWVFDLLPGVRYYLTKKQVFQGRTVHAYFRGKGNLDKITIWHSRLILILWEQVVNVICFCLNDMVEKGEKHQELTYWRYDYHQLI